MAATGAAMSMPIPTIVVHPPTSEATPNRIPKPRRTLLSPSWRPGTTASSFLYPYAGRPVSYAYKTLTTTAYDPYAAYQPPQEPELAFFTAMYLAFAPFLAPFIHLLSMVTGLWEDNKLPLPITTRQPRTPLALFVMLVLGVLGLSCAIYQSYDGYGDGYGLVYGQPSHHVSRNMYAWDY